jgi:hypothetical protein
MMLEQNQGTTVLTGSISKSGMCTMCVRLVKDGVVYVARFKEEIAQTVDHSPD